LCAEAARGATLSRAGSPSGLDGMKLIIFAATGGIGRQLLAQAAAAGHEVTAVVRNPGKLDGKVRTVRADLAATDPAALVSALSGADAVLSGLGPRGPSDFGIATPGTRAIVRAMSSAGVRRLVVVSAAPVSTTPSAGRPSPPRRDPGEGFFMRNLLTPLIKLLLRRHYADLAGMEDALRESGLDWTVVRPPRLTDGPLTLDYRTAVDRNLRRGLVISRADVAHFMLRAIDRPETIGKAIGIAS
jgi:putative NADH-flavin reductase